MIIQDFHIKKYDWDVRIYYAIDKVFKEEIVDYLIKLGCSGKEFEKLLAMLDDFDFNSGFAYSNPEMKSSVLLIGVASSASEFLNTLIHEIGHLVMHIVYTFDIDPFSEEMQYLNGGIVKSAFMVAKHFLCDKCRY